MRVRFSSSTLDRLESDPDYDAGLARALVVAYRRRMQQIRAATDERAFYELKSLHFEKLQGARSHQRSMRLNDKWRLILELEEQDSEKTVVIVGVEDYH